jgi:4-methyl-5(b-hydroxyethyl)-thiazole monophosphate biosynthesis
MSALVFLAPGFEEIEAITVIDILRRAEIETIVAGLTTNPIPAARHTRHLADIHLADVDPTREFEIVILPGGAEGAKRLGESPLVKQWLNRQRERGHWVAAICAAPTALQAHGWLRDDQKITSHLSVQKQFPSTQMQSDQRVVLDEKGKLITSLAAGSALEFAYAILRQLRGPDAVKAVNTGVCAVI